MVITSIESLLEVKTMSDEFEIPPTDGETSETTRPFEALVARWVNNMNQYFEFERKKERREKEKANGVK